MAVNAARGMLDAATSEDRFLADVMQFAHDVGIMLVYHPWRSYHSAKGWPDLALCRENHDGTTTLFLFELKDMKRAVTPEQAEWLDALARVRDVQAGAFRPADAETVMRLLTEGR